MIIINCILQLFQFGLFVLDCGWCSSVSAKNLYYSCIVFLF
jgi:hypothetical protein